MLSKRQLGNFTLVVLLIVLLANMKCNESTNENYCFKESKNYLKEHNSLGIKYVFDTYLKSLHKSNEEIHHTLTNYSTRVEISESKRCDLDFFLDKESFPKDPYIGKHLISGLKNKDSIHVRLTVKEYFTQSSKSCYLIKSIVDLEQD